MKNMKIFPLLSSIGSTRPNINVVICLKPAREKTKKISWLSKATPKCEIRAFLSISRWVTVGKILLLAPEHGPKSKKEDFAPGTISIKLNSRKLLSKIIGEMSRPSTKEIWQSMYPKSRKKKFILWKPKEIYISSMKKLKGSTGILLASRKTKSTKLKQSARLKINSFLKLHQNSWKKSRSRKAWFALYSFCLLSWQWEEDSIPGASPSKKKAIYFFLKTTEPEKKIQKSSLILTFSPPMKIQPTICLQMREK